MQKFNPNGSSPADALWTQSGLQARFAPRILPACRQPPWLQHQGPFACWPAADPARCSLAAQFTDPISCAVVGSNLAVSYNTENVVLLLSPTGTPLTSFNTTGYRTYGVADAGNGTLFYSALSPSFSNAEVQQVSFDGSPIATSVGFAGTRFFPVAMTVQPQEGDPQRIFVTSSFGNAVYILTRDL